MIEEHEHDNTWLIERFNRIDADNDEIKQDLKVIGKQVIQHGVYWNIAKGISAAVGGTALATLAGFLGFHKNH